MSLPVIQEWDPATGRFVAGTLPENLFMDDDEETGPELHPLASPEAVAALAASYGGPAPEPTPAKFLLSLSGREKLYQLAQHVATREELSQIHEALNHGLSESVAISFGLLPSDLEVPLPPPAPAPAPPPAPAPAAVPSACGPTSVRHVDLGGGWVTTVPEQKADPGPGVYKVSGLTPSGYYKVEAAIQAETEMQKLNVLDKVLKKGDITRLREILALLPWDIRDDLDPGDVDANTDASQSDDEDAEDSNSDEEEEYDPFNYTPPPPAEPQRKAGSSVSPDVPADPADDEILAELTAAAAEGSLAVAKEPEPSAPRIASHDPFNYKAPAEPQRHAIGSASPDITPDDEILRELAAAATDGPPVAAQEFDRYNPPAPPQRDGARSLSPDDEILAELAAAAAAGPPAAVQDDYQIIAELKTALARHSDRPLEELELGAAAAASLFPELARQGKRPPPGAQLPEPKAKAPPSFQGGGAAPGPPPKRARTGAQEAEASKPLEWPLELAQLSNRTTCHPDFRPLLRSESSRCAGNSARQPVAFAALSVSLVYVGDASSGFNARYPGRIAAVDERGVALLDLFIRPQAPLLDCRTHLTGLTPEHLLAESAVDLDTACNRLTSFLRPDTLLAGYKVVSELQALGMWHWALIDVALLFGAEAAQSPHCHSLRYLAEQLLREDMGPGEDEPGDALGRARLTMRLVQHEANQPTPTPPFAPRAPSGCEFVVRHIPHSWGATAAATLQRLMPAARLGGAVRWLLSDDDATDWRGEAQWTFRTKADCDAAFDALPGLTDVSVKWQDPPDAPSLGAFVSEQALTQAFSEFGVVISARVPRHTITKEPQNHAYISFLEAADAQRVAMQPVVEVRITPEWKLALRPQLVRDRHAMEKRLGVRVPAAPGAEGADWEFDWIQVCRL